MARRSIMAALTVFVVGAVGVMMSCASNRIASVAVVLLRFSPDSQAQTRNGYPDSPDFVSHRGQYGFRFASFGRQITDVLK